MVNELGYVAGMVTVASFLPQVVRAWRTRQTRDLSLASLALLITVGIASLLTLPDSRRLLALAVAGPLLLTSLRAGRMLSRIRRFDPLTMARAFAVALVYDVSRALALVVRTPHRVRQNASLSARVPGREA